VAGSGDGDIEEVGGGGGPFAGAGVGFVGAEYEDDGVDVFALKGMNGAGRNPVLGFAASISRQWGAMDRKGGDDEDVVFVWG